MVTDAPRSGTADAGICVGLFLVGLGMALVLAPLRMDVLDDGLYLYQANLLAHGGVPYRDFLMHDAPLGTMWHALLLHLFGNDVLVLRLAVLPFKAVLLPVVYLLARPLVPAGVAVGAAVTVPIVDTNLNYTVAHVALNALGLGALGVELLAAWRRERGPGLLVAAGACLGLATGFKQNMGLFLLAAAVLWLLEPEPESETAAPEDRSRRRIDPWRTAAWAGVVAAALLLVRDHPEAGVLGSLVLPIAVLAVPAVAGGRSGGTGRPRLRPVVWLVAGWGAVTLPWMAWLLAQVGAGGLVEGLLLRPSRLAAIWFIPLRPPLADLAWLLGATGGGLLLAVLLPLVGQRLGGRRAAGPVTLLGLGVYAGCLLAFPAWQGVAITGMIYGWLYFNILVFWPAFLLSLRLAPGPRRHVRLLLLAAVLLALEMYPQMRRINGNWCFPLFLPLAGWVLWSLGQWASRAVARDRMGGLAKAPGLALCVLPLLVGWWAAQWRLGNYVDVAASMRVGGLRFTRLMPLDLPHFHVLDTPEAVRGLQAATAAVAAHTSAGEAIYAFPRGIAFYVAAERPSALVNVYPEPGTAVVEGERLRDALAAANPRVIVADNAATRAGIPYDPLTPDLSARWAVPLRDYLRAGYRPLLRGDPWTVWTRAK